MFELNTKLTFAMTWSLRQVAVFVVMFLIVLKVLCQLSTLEPRLTVTLLEGHLAILVALAQSQIISDIDKNYRLFVLVVRSPRY